MFHPEAGDVIFRIDSGRLFEFPAEMEFVAVAEFFRDLRKFQFAFLKESTGLAESLVFTEFPRGTAGDLVEQCQETGRGQIDFPGEARKGNAFGGMGRDELEYRHEPFHVAAPGGQKTVARSKAEQFRNKVESEQLLARRIEEIQILRQIHQIQHFLFDPLVFSDDRRNVIKTHQVEGAENPHPEMNPETRTGRRYGDVAVPVGNAGRNENDLVGLAFDRFGSGDFQQGFRVVFPGIIADNAAEMEGQRPPAGRALRFRCRQSADEELEMGIQRQSLLAAARIGPPPGLIFHFRNFIHVFSNSVNSNSVFMV